jgi:hypothetical protein
MLKNIGVVMIGKTKNDQIDDKIITANFSALLYLMTEQQVLIGKLLQALLDSNTLDSCQLTQVTDIHSGPDGLIPAYTELYNRFATYYLHTKKILQDRDNINFGEDIWEVEKDKTILEKDKTILERLQKLRNRKDKDHG